MNSSRDDIHHVNWKDGPGPAVGAVLKLWRKDAGYTQAALAKLMGTCPAQVRRMERGDHAPSWGRLVGFSRATGGDLRQVLQAVDAYWGLGQ